MPDLFADAHPIAPPTISGLSYLRDYITPHDEAALVAAIDAEPWDETWDRRRQPYGASYGDKRKGVVKPIPSWGVKFIERLRAEGVGDRSFDQMLVNEYEPGQGISLHRDYDPFDRTVVSLSLLSPCVMDFRNVDGRKESMLLEPRSLLVLEDDARDHWEHGIARRKTDRWAGDLITRRRRLSVTFRMLKR